MDLSILSDKEKLPALAKTKLAGISVNFARQMAVIESRRNSGKPWQPAGVLIPICFKEQLPGQGGSKGGFVVQLIRRSSKVAQGGDISGPGGMLSPRLDRLFRLPLAWGMTSILRGPARASAKNKGAEEYDATALFLANALRESWEELRLNPCNVDFLGPLPFHDLIMFTRTIFPLVGLVKKDQTYRPNSEVDRVVEIPLSAFFDEGHYATYCVNNSDRPEITRF